MRYTLNIVCIHIYIQTHTAISLSLSFSGSLIFSLFYCCRFFLHVCSLVWCLLSNRVIVNVNWTHWILSLSPPLSLSHSLDLSFFTLSMCPLFRPYTSISKKRAATRISNASSWIQTRLYNCCCFPHIYYTPFWFFLALFKILLLARSLILSLSVSLYLLLCISVFHASFFGMWFSFLHPLLRVFFSSFLLL